jgi:iron complex outermembrane receptor protein
MDAPRIDTPGATLSEHLLAVPGLLARDRHNQAQDEQLSIRGFGTRASFGIRGVRLLVDGVPATMPDGQGQVSHFPLANAQRIEVLRGPFSVLYGNAAGGVIQLFTADGEAPPSIGMAWEAGSDQTYRLALDTRGAHDAWRWNIGASHAATDGVREHGRARRDLLNAKLVHLDAADTFTLLFNAIDSPAQDPLGLDAAQFRTRPDSVAAGALLFDTRKSVAQQQLGVVWSHRAGSHEWRAMAYAGRRHVTQFLSIPVATQRNPLSGGGVIDLRAPYAGLDLRWSGQGSLAGRPLEFTAGASFDRQRQDRHGYENFVGDVLGVRGAPRLDQDDRVDAFDQYAQATWWPRVDLSLMAGVRHSRVRFASRDHFVTARNPDDSGRVHYTATSPVLGANWRVAPAWNVYGAWGEGFETPTFNELSYRSDGGSGLNFALRAARTRSAELGAKFARGGLRSELALFRADTGDELTVATSSGGRTTYQNAGHARRTGAEWSASLALGDPWRLQFAATWIDARFRDAFLACAGTPCARPDIPVPPRTRIPGVPDASVYLALHRGGARGWQWQLDARASRAVPVNAFDDERAPGYAAFGVGGGYGFGDASGEGRVFAAIENLLDRRHAGSVIVNEGNRRYYEPAPGRSFNLGVEWRWNP